MNDIVIISYSQEINDRMYSIKFFIAS